MADDFEGNEIAALAGAKIKQEMAAIGAGIGGGFKNTQELHC